VTSTAVAAAALSSSTGRSSGGFGEAPAQARFARAAAASERTDSRERESDAASSSTHTSHPGTASPGSKASADLPFQAAAVAAVLASTTTLCGSVPAEALQSPRSSPRSLWMLRAAGSSKSGLSAATDLRTSSKTVAVRSSSLNFMRDGHARRIRRISGGHSMSQKTTPGVPVVLGGGIPNSSGLPQI
jgi:hypothetical protein